MCQLNKPTLKNTTHQSDEGRFLLKAVSNGQTKAKRPFLTNHVNTVSTVTRSMAPTHNRLIECLSPIAFSALFLAFFF